MLNEHIGWSKETMERKNFLSQVDLLYRKGLEVVKGGKLYGYQVNINNPKEVIAVLYLLAEDYNRFHERM